LGLGGIGSVNSAAEAVRVRHRQGSEAEQTRLCAVPVSPGGVPGQPGPVVMAHQVELVETRGIGNAVDILHHQLIFVLLWVGWRGARAVAPKVACHGAQRLLLRDPLLHQREPPQGGFWETVQRDQRGESRASAATWSVENRIW